MLAYYASEPNDFPYMSCLKSKAFMSTEGLFLKTGKKNSSYQVHFGPLGP